MTYLASENRIPHYGSVGLSDLQQAIGRSSSCIPDLLCDAGATLDKLNKWSKSKPFVWTADLGNSRYTDNNSQRLAAAKASGWGFGADIPTYASKSAFLAAANGRSWYYNRPVTAPCRIGDMLGYRGKLGMESEWGLSRTDAKNLYFPFGGIVTINDARCGPYDVVKIATLDPEDPDGGSTGLLYPADFYGFSNPSYYQFYDWYFGLALTNGTDLLFFVDTQKLSHYTGGDAPRFDNLTFTKNGGGAFITSGYYTIYPVFCSMPGTLSRWQEVTWGGESVFPGRVAFIDGYTLPVRIDTNKMGLSFNYSYSGNGVFSVTISNNTGSSAAIAANELYLYVTSEAVFDGPDYPAIAGALTDWLDNGVRYTSGISSTPGIVSRYADIYALFLAANGSNTLAAGAGTTLTVPIGSSSDPQGNPYNAWAQLDLCAGLTIGGTYQRQTL